ncbi:hypothetical protein NDU88_001607 [Pleurodeles waltl]|uniref:Uncharacterized protein n=1 Tax=Pleurodeles waltl TaxID=8319 RepID=A0AAV7RBS0_PLEWA|nr:hypothetical protein NDU88_001607 [Pleurodeles waltl]
MPSLDSRATRKQHCELLPSHRLAVPLCRVPMSLKRSASAPVTCVLPYPVSCWSDVSRHCREASPERCRSTTGHPAHARVCPAGVLWVGTAGRHRQNPWNADGLPPATPPMPVPVSVPRWWCWWCCGLADKVRRGEEWR